MGKRIPTGDAEQLLGPQPANAERAVGQQRCIQPATVAQRRHQQGIGPDQEADHHAGFHAAPAGTAPVQAAQQAGRELRHGGEGHQAVGGQHGVVVAAAVVTVSHQRQQQDRQAADPQHPRSDIGRFAVVATAAQQQRHHQVVADHRGQRDRRHDDHAGGGGEAAHIGHQRQCGAATCHRQRQHQGVIRRQPGTEHRRASSGDGHDHQRDQDQVAAKHPAGAAHVTGIAAFHHRHVELAWQADQRQKAEQGLRDKAHRRHALEQGARRGHHRFAAVGEPDIGKHAYRHHRHQLDHRLHGDGQHHAVMVVGGIHLAGAEQDGEQGHQQRHVQRRISKEALAGDIAAEHLQAHRHGLVLQCQVGHHADQRDQRHQCRQAPRAAEARGDEVCDGHHVLAAGDQRQPLDDAPAEDQQQQRAKIDRQVADAITHRRADRAVEGPGRAIDRQRQAVDHRPQPGAVRVQRPTVAPPRHAEQQRGIAE